MLLSNISYSQTLIYYDNMESTSTWKGTSTVITNSYFNGGVSTGVDNPPNYSMYSSFDSCYTIKGTGLGSSTIEVDTFIFPNASLISGRQYQIRFKLASFGLNYSIQTAAGVDQTDWFELQYSPNNGLTWWRDIQIQGISNAMWSFDGAIGTNAKLNVNRVGSTSTTTPTIYVSNAGNPIVNVSVTLPFVTITQLRIRFISRINASGETFMLDDVEVWDMSSTLPVELLGFSGIDDDGIIKLYWETASEINNDYFIISKSVDGINYDNIGSVDGNGNSNQIMSYSYYDNRPYDGINYYKLTQVDFDGNKESFIPIAIRNIKKNTKTIKKIVNILGQEVDENYDGLKIYYFNDNTYKVIQ